MPTSKPVTLVKTKTNTINQISQLPIHKQYYQPLDAKSLNLSALSFLHMIDEIDRIKQEMRAAPEWGELVSGGVRFE